MHCTAESHSRQSISKSILPGMNLPLLSSAFLLVATTLAQDTYHCPDGWDKQEDRDACR